MSKEEEKKRLSEALILHPQIKNLNYLGGGNRGEAYLLNDNKVLKITNDYKEYSSAMIIKNRNLKHIINVYDVWSVDCTYDEEETEIIYVIIEEYIDTSSKKDIVTKFVSVFKHAWFCVYFPDIERRRKATSYDLDEYMRDPKNHLDAIDYTKQFVLKEGAKNNLHNEFGKIYDQLISAYVELYQNAPDSHLDLNDGNIGFTSDGILKVFDMQ